VVRYAAARLPHCDDESAPREEETEQNIRQRGPCPAGSDGDKTASIVR